MSDSILTKMLTFARRFWQSSKAASYDVAKYLYLKLPSFIQLLLQSLHRWTPQRQVGLPSSVASQSSDLFVDIANKFQVSEAFVRLYRDQGHGPIDWSMPNWVDFFENLPALQKITVPYAMSTVIRGRDTLSLLESHSSIRHKNRFLDVGTGYGGFLRAAKEMGFKEVVGIELQSDLVELSVANIYGLRGARVIAEDFLKGDFTTLGSFDLITCNDVIEHVDDAEFAIQKMSSLRSEDGCISFEVPNKDAIPFVKADGHFLIFGITQLPKHEAAEYHSAYTGAEKSYYNFEMGDMYDLDWYLQKLSENGLSAFIADKHSIGDAENVPHLLADLKEAYREWQKTTKPRLDKAIAERVTFSVDEYIRNLEQDLYHLGDETSKIRFKNKYLRTFWTIIATNK